MSSKHKSHSLDKECLCSKCPLRFFCFTEERVFSDPIYQGLFEALMAQGKSKEEALDEVANEIKLRMNRVSFEPLQPYEPIVQPYTVPYPSSAPNVQPYIQPWTIFGQDSSISFDVNDEGKIQVSYTMCDGREINWQCKSL